MNLSDINTIRSLLKANNFSFKKSLGQNFLINPDICPKMAMSCCDNETGVIEIGPGIGVLTKELSLLAKRVIAIELDERLKKILNVTLDGCNNTEIIFDDVIKLDLNNIIKEKLYDCNKIAICANLPYYITSPIIMQLLENKINVDSITVMVQKEAAVRLCAEVGTREAGAVTVAVNYYSTAEILFNVSRESFMPPPNVDSAVIKLVLRKDPPVSVNSEKKFFSFVKCCFAQRRKTLVNTVSNTTGINKDIIKSALDTLNISQTVRSEQLSINQLADLSNILFK